MQDGAKHLAPQLVDDLPPHIPHVVGLDEVAQPAQDEHSDQCQGYPDNSARVAVLERAVPQLLRKEREGRHDSGKKDTAQNTERELPAVRPQVSQQALVGRHRAGVAPHGGSIRRSQGLPAGPSLTVAMLTSAKPRRPSTSMAVITD